MKKLLLTLIALGLSLNCAFAVGLNSNAYFDKGLIISGSTFPQSVSNEINNIDSKNIQNLKTGVSVKRNILGLIELGDAGIQQAAKQGGITKIHYVDISVNKVYIPLLFIPIYAKATQTTVYGE